MGAEPGWVAALRDARRGRLAGGALRYLESVGSTNDEARRWLDRGGPDGLVVIAGRQIAGRGRRGRRWSSPPGKGLYLSVGLRPAVAGAAAGRLTFLGAVAAAEALRGMGLPAEIRWPNDVDVRGRKIAGVLAESRIEGETASSAIVGIGVNLRHGPADLPADARATSVAAEGMTPDEARLADSILERLEAWLAALSEPDPRLLDRWRQLAPGHLGRRVRVQDEGASFTGVTRGIDDDGALLVQRDDGPLAVVRAGELRRIREG